ncbi:DUF3071 domain-containing protein [Actinomycetaceae bacterium TAE3-ERU4]|nr:DUF3071 domain-containing protein [Actinomycetaceae bacterium TAE3-ERU4]
MRELELLGIHSDNQHLVLTDESGARYTLPIDDQLRALCKAAHPFSTTNEASNTSSLRPRDIQRLYRAGLTPAEVAATHNIDVATIERYESAVLNERSFIAQKARKTAITSETGAPLLGDLVLDRLATRGVSPEEVSWDATRSDNDPWLVHVYFNQAANQFKGTWQYDPRSAKLIALDEESRWLTEGTPNFEESNITRLPRTSRSLGSTKEEAELSSNVPVPPSTNSVEEESRMVSLLERLSANRGKRVEVSLEEEDGSVEDEVNEMIRNARTNLEIAAEDAQILPLREDEETTVNNDSGQDSLFPEYPRSEKQMPPSKKTKKGRRSVPGWDEIILGTKTD